MKLTWYGTAALLFEEDETAIAFDPFAGIPFREAHPDREPLPYSGDLRKASDVFVTHGHFDHILQIPTLYASDNTVIHATKTPCRTLQKNGLPARQMDCIVPGQTLSVRSFTIHTYQGRHCRFDVRLILQTVFRRCFWQSIPHMLRLLHWNHTYPENGEILFYELCAGGKRIQIMGSMGLDLSVCYPTGADYLILPYQGKSPKRLAAYGAALVQQLQPKAVLLDHYDNSFHPMSSQIQTAALETLLAEAYDIPCRPLKKNETILL